MRRLVLAFAVTAALALPMAAPAVAAPENNPWAFPLTVTCGSDTWEAISTGKVGWIVDGPAGTTPGVSVGGTHRIYVDGQLVSEETYSPPRGLLDQLQTCRVERSFEPNGLSVWDPAYIFWPAR